ncbi:hypothetical protein Bca101_088220 [Brassica carinata]
MKGVEQSVASGNMGIENLKTPWVPNFKGIPAKMTDSAVESEGQDPILEPSAELNPARGMPFDLTGAKEMSPPAVSSPFGRVTKVPRQELSGDDRGTNPLAVAGRLFCFTIRPGRLSLTSVAYEFTSIPGRVQLDEESILANKYNPYTHLGAPLPAYPYKTRVRFFLVGLGGFDKKCYAYTQDYPSSRKLRGDYFTTTDDSP